MNKTTKVLSFTVAMFAIAGLMVAFNNQVAYARPDPGLGFDVEHVMKINLKGVPTDGDAKCSGNSNNIYMHVPTGGHQHVDVTHGDFNHVTDNCTRNIDGDRAGLTLDDPGTEYWMTIRHLGSPASDLKFCSQTKLIHDGDPLDHCVLSSIDTHNGKPKFSVPGKVFDEALEDQTWNFDGNSKFRNAQIDIWKAAP